MIYQEYVKRGFDFIVAAAGLVVVCVPVALAMVTIWLSSPGPVFFMQTRIGRSGRRFAILKLRTMTVNPARQVAQTDNSDPEVFFVGKILRRLKIDELPQLWNILRGDMSLVGPRPCLEETSNEMPAWARQRFAVRPGITGLAQVHGNIALSWEERWAYDVEYVKKLGPLLDFAILCKTAIVVLLGEERYKKPL